MKRGTDEWAAHSQATNAETKAGLSRRDALSLIGKSAALAVTAGGAGALPCVWGEDKSVPVVLRPALLESLQRAGFGFFWEQASPLTGLVKDRVSGRGSDQRTLSSIAATGFGLAALCIADSRRYQASKQIKQRAAATLSFLLTRAPAVNGFFYHFMDMNAACGPSAANYRPSIRPFFSAAA